MQNAGTALGGTRASKRYFQCLWDIDAERIAQLLANEHPQLIAVILANLPPEKAAAVLSLLEEDSQTEVALRISTTDEIEPDVIAEIEQTIRSALSSVGGDSQGPAGANVLVDILNNAESATRTLALEALKGRDPEMAADVRKRMFLFEDVTLLSDRAVQVLLREADQEHLRLALKGATDDIKELVFKNMSERAAESLREDLELVEQAAPRDVELAQQRVAATVRRLVAAKEISIDEPVGENVAEATKEAEQSN
jgi:flagellar motor switch protein FliG